MSFGAPRALPEPGPVTDAPRLAWRGREREGGLAVAVRVQPRARRSRVEGTASAGDGARLRIAVAEPPEDGRATRAACETLARALGIPDSRVTLAAGGASRLKTLYVAGGAAELAARMARL